MQTIVVPLLPDFPRILGVTADDASWLVTATLLTSAVATPIMSRSADMYGKRKIMVICLAIMVVGSIIAAVGGSFLWIIIGRALQGFSSSLIPVGISIMRDELPKERMGSAVALMSATLGIGSAMGLPLAGLVFEALGWQSIFWVSAVAGALLLVSVAVVVPESKLRTPGRFDYAGAVILSAALVALLLAISKGGSWGWGSETVLMLFLAAALLLAAWVPYELKVSHPMVDLRTSARRPVLLTNVASLLIGFAMFANMLLTTQQLQLPTATGYGFELDVVAAGLCMVPSGAAMVIFAPVSGSIIRRFGGKAALITGSAVMIVGYVGRVFLWDTVPWLIIGSTVISIGTAIAYAAMPTLIMGAVPITHTASANGLNSLVRSIGTSTSSAAVAVLLMSVNMPFGAVTVPSFDAFRDVFWLAALASGASVLAAAFIPRAASAPRTITQEGVTSELVVQGRVLLAEHRAMAPAVVTVLDTSGEPVDWSRVDNEGNYSVALPGVGKYLLVANAAGWAPIAEVFEFDGRVLKQDFRLQDRLSLAGTATAGGTPVPAAVIALLQASGEYVATTQSDKLGRYAFPLPMPGRYILTMLHPVTHQAAARKLAVDNRSVSADLEVGLASPGRKESVII
ncbi:MFS transporter [Pseudarthrobacter sulfonivorans]|nr:MFS transporter [Pseudarthrobacter sulfonivorans]